MIQALLFIGTFFGQQFFVGTQKLDRKTNPGSDKKKLRDPTNKTLSSDKKTFPSKIRRKTPTLKNSPVIIVRATRRQRKRIFYDTII